MRTTGCCLLRFGTVLVTVLVESRVGMRVGVAHRHRAAGGREGVGSRSECNLRYDPVLTVLLGVGGRCRE